MFYTLTTLVSDLGVARTVGIFKDVTVYDTVIQNIGDIHENYYDYAVVESFDFGLYPQCKHRDWYKWVEPGQYVPCEQPTWHSKYISHYTHVV